MTIRHEAARDFAKRLVPFALRVELVRLRRMPRYLAEHSGMARGKGSSKDFGFTIVQRSSPLCRDAAKKNDPLQKGKEQNVALASHYIDGIVVAPGQVFSYHHAVGRPTRLRGFRRGLELQDATPAGGIGGGCCQVSNLLYLLALEAGMEIVERHRHKLDLFADHGRTVPFGCGATVFFNTADLRFRNPLDQPVRISLRIEEGHLVGEIRAQNDLGFDIAIYEVDHHFRREGDVWIRENRIRRKRTNSGGEVLTDEEVAHNVGRCLYDPEAAQ